METYNNLKGARGDRAQAFVGVKEELHGERAVYFNGW